MSNLPRLSDMQGLISQIEAELAASQGRQESSFLSNPDLDDQEEDEEVIDEPEEEIDVEPPPDDLENPNLLTQFMQTFSSQIPPVEVSEFLWWFYPPIIGFLAFLFIFVIEHYLGIIIFLSHFISTIRCDQQVKLAMLPGQDRRTQKGELWNMILFNVLNITVSLLLLAKYSYLNCIILLPVDSKLSFIDALFVATMNDLLLKMFTILIKSLILATCHFSKKRLGNILSLVEVSSLYYRGAAPVPVWVSYLDTRGGPVDFVVLGVYLGCKFLYFTRMSQSWLIAAKETFVSKQEIGVRPSSADLLEAGDQCSICQETMTDPVKLECSHIFCEDCVLEWFQRRKTCPLCRKEIVAASNLSTHKNGATSLSILIF